MTETFQERKAPKVTAMSVFSVRRKKETERQREKSSRSKTTALMSGGGSSYITEGAHHAWLLSANRATPEDPPTSQSITAGQLRGPSARRHVNTCARFASRRSCFREVNCVTVGGDTSVEERALVGSRQNTQLLFHISINTTASQDSRPAQETLGMLVNSCK